MLKVKDLFDLTHTQANEYLSAYEYPWQALQGIKQFILQAGERLNKAEYEEISPKVWVHKSAKIAPTAQINAPCIIGAETEIRHCAFIRGSVIVGENCTVGNSVEIKNAILFDGAQVPHFNYIGDSVLGYKAHFGAGAVTSNIKSDKTPVSVKCGDESLQTGQRKVGAFVGDFAEVGCNCVLNPGTVIGKGSRIYPLSCVRGTVAENSIYKNNGVITPIK